MEYSSEDDVGRLLKYSKWSPLDKLRLAAYKKEDKPLKWIFSKFPGRTEGASGQQIENEPVLPGNETF